MKFSGTQDYVATEDLTIAVNAAVTLERPLLIKGELNSSSRAFILLILPFNVLISPL